MDFGYPQTHWIQRRYFKYTASHNAFVTLYSQSISEEITRWISRHKKAEEQIKLRGNHVSFIQTIRPVQVQFSTEDLLEWQDVPETDRHVVAAAVIGSADIIVTGNMRHINKPSVREVVAHVLNPLQFLVWFKKNVRLIFSGVFSVRRRKPRVSSSP